MSRAAPDPATGAGDDPARVRAEPAPTHRPVRSFVLRTGRTTEAQKRAFAQHWSRYGLEYTGQPRDFTRDFGHQRPLVLEIGFGNGEALRFAAGQDPARDHLGIEVHTPGVGRLLQGLAADARDNVRLYRHDAVEVLGAEIGPAGLDEIRIFFPDPWHKKRHHKRRLIQPAFAELLGSRLRRGGLLHLATDWEPYAEHMLDVLEAQPAFENLAGPRGRVERPPWRPQTRFETRGQRLGHAVADLLFRRR